MSLYGALFGGVSGLRAQSSKIGVISDNISNVNTVGYKQSTGEFQTLVVNSSSTGTYQTGGVRGGTRLAVSKQGLLSSTDAPTDIAMSGNGLFVVRQTATITNTSDTSALPLFTRAGSFRQDSLGNFVNAQGFFLQGWPLDREGRLPGEPGNLNTIAFTNFDSLQTVNVESASGVAQSTSLIELGTNLNAGEVIFPGEAVTGVPDARTTANANINAEAIIVGDEYGFATQNNLHRGDMFEVITGTGNTYRYLYGGFTVGRDISTAGIANVGDSNVDNTALRALGAAASAITVGAGNTYVITLANHGMITGDQVDLSGFAGALGATPAAQLNATHTVTWLTNNTFSITVGTPHGGAVGTNVNPGNINADTRQFAGNILNASSAGSTFLGGSTPSTSFTTAALSFTIATTTKPAVTFTYVNTSPNTFDGQFNSLATLAQAINEVNGLSARVAGTRLVVSSEDPAEAVTFANGDIVGSGDGTRRGLNWTAELGLANVSLPAAFPGTDTRRFNSLQSLANIVNADVGLSATVLNPLSASSIEIRVDDPSTTIQLRDLALIPAASVPIVGTPVNIPAGGPFSGTIDITINTAPPTGLTVNDYVSISGLNLGGSGLPYNWPNGSFLDVTNVTVGSYTVRYTIPAGVSINPVAGNYAAPAGNSVSVIGRSNQGSILGALTIADGNGVPTTPLTGVYSQIDTGTLGPRYDVTGTVGDNMASGNITAQFSRNIRIYDSLGSGHDVRFSFIKTAQNTWAVEIHAIPETDVSSTLPDGQIATGTINFNGDGSLRSVSTSLTNALTINWTNGASTSSIALDLGTAGQPFGTVGATVIGLTDGLSQFDSSYNVSFANQNGAPVGQLVSVSITDEGEVVASYSNGETQSLYKLPIADFANYDGLRAISGNVYSQTRESGEVNLREAGTNGTGTVVSGALEQSNVDLAEQLTDMIVAQRAYQANTRVIKTTDELLEQLNQL
ncbi:MAG: flagellar hook-basal body complex protein [Rickettsiales bacterium]